jgi:acyl-CoA thioester hydrolase
LKSGRQPITWLSRCQKPPGRGGRDRRSAGRSARDGAAHRSAAGEGAGASQLRRMVRSDGGGARGAVDAVHAQAVLAEGGELDDQVERRAELLSEPREHAFEKVGRGSDGRAGFLQVPLHEAREGSGSRLRSMSDDPFRHRIRVRYSECDQQGVVFYPHYLAWFDIAMTELFRARGHPYGEMIDGGADMVVAEAGVRYRASAHFDEEVDLTARVTRLGSTSITTAITAQRANDGRVLAEGELRHVFVDLATRRTREIPARVREALAPFTAEAEPIA